LAADLDALRALGVTSVCNCTNEVRNYFDKKDDTRLTIQYLRLPWYECRVAALIAAAAAAST
jgi:hypothetical protein